MARHGLFHSSLVAFLAANFSFALGGAQSKPTFEVASVKQNLSGPRGTVPRQDVQPGGRFTATNQPLTSVIQFAYNIRDFQLTGGPDWVRNDRFDIAGKAAQEVPREQILLMVQALLEDRFRLIVRKEAREMPIHALVLDRSDGRLGRNLVKLSDAITCEAARSQPDPYQPQTGTLTAMTTGCGPLSLIADRAITQVRTIVVDQTGLTGEWFFRLSYAPGIPPSTAGRLAPDPNAAAFPTALQEQLGLKLQATRGPVDVFIIESVQQPPVD